MNEEQNKMEIRLARRHRARGMLRPGTYGHLGAPRSPGEAWRGCSVGCLARDLLPEAEQILKSADPERTLHAELGRVLGQPFWLLRAQDAIFDRTGDLDFHVNIALAKPITCDWTTVQRRIVRALLGPIIRSVREGEVAALVRDVHWCLRRQPSRTERTELLSRGRTLQAQADDDPIGPTASKWRESVLSAAIWAISAGADDLDASGRAVERLFNELAYFLHYDPALRAAGRGKSFEACGAETQAIFLEALRGPKPRRPVI